MAQSWDPVIGRVRLDAPLSPAQESRVREMLEEQLVKLGLINARRCATCENWCPIGTHCFLFDSQIPEDVLPVGCDDWKQGI